MHVALQANQCFYRLFPTYDNLRNQTSVKPDTSVKKKKLDKILDLWYHNW